ncbi:hypothetical protein BKA82DRAFT_4215273 [Pisolithus tinctorius]|nr:hypothetical protein BKA82DRAFT_4215273 [Pisolithus tinctorius]
MADRLLLVALISRSYSARAFSPRCGHVRVLKINASSYEGRVVSSVEGLAADGRDDPLVMASKLPRVLDYRALSSCMIA